MTGVATTTGDGEGLGPSHTHVFAGQLGGDAWQPLAHQLLSTSAFSSALHVDGSVPATSAGVLDGSLPLRQDFEDFEDFEDLEPVVCRRDFLALEGAGSMAPCAFSIFLRSFSSLATRCSSSNALLSHQLLLLRLCASSAAATRPSLASTSCAAFSSFVILRTSASG